ncbi:microtubule-associated protein Jupiter isoform X1 [Drosophila gunungcola]|uniref:microtubule-associated protein Jupiter isoform X1 n=1 Tax=Drosophila gunungcola TaxID=103775 RepID=UPI0022E0EB57|nr:microtubule-associated protein Jupiter isoform X1 [Drosophila gunungcola]
MAAYAAFKHVELYNVGKAKKRVLRPPGGGSSDIFGSEMPQTPRNVKNRMVSNIFAAEKDNGVKNNVRQGAHRFYFIGDAPRRGQKTVDSHSRLFGEPSRPITPGKNHMKSSIPFGGQNSEAAAAQKLLTTNGHYNGKSGSVSSASSSVSSSTENLKMNNGSRSGKSCHRRGLQGRRQRLPPAPGVFEWRHSGDQQEPCPTRRLLVGTLVMTTGIAQIPAQAMWGRWRDETPYKKATKQAKNHTTHIILRIPYP